MPEWVPGRVRLVGEEGLGLYRGFQFAALLLWGRVEPIVIGGDVAAFEGRQETVASDAEIPS